MKTFGAIIFSAVRHPASISKRTINQTLLSLSLVILSTVGCQPVTAIPTLTPTSTPAPTLTSPPLPPTATASATLVPATPTASPTPLPPIPTADFALADIVGTWMRSDLERGNLFLTFLETGAYRAAHGTPEGIIQSGTYTLEGRLLTFEKGWNCSPLPDTTLGQYVLRLGGKGQWLFLDLYTDTCPSRPSALKSFRWTRFVPTPTPTP